MSAITSVAAQPTENVTHTLALVFGQHLIRDCIGLQLAGHLPGFNIRLLERSADLVELRDRDSMSLVVLWIDTSDTGFESAFEAALEAASKGPIALLVDFIDPALARRALTHGVRAYLSTSMSLAELASAIRFVAAGGTYISPSVLDAMSTDRPAPVEGEEHHRQFSPRQLDVLERLQEGKQNKIIAYELGMAESTVKVHIRSIMKKLNARNRTEVVLKTNRLQRTARAGHFQNVVACVAPRFANSANTTRTIGSAEPALSLPAKTGSGPWRVPSR